MAIWWLNATGGVLSMQSGVRVRPMLLVLLAGVTAFNVIIRFVRWHFLLRRLDVTIPTRQSLLIYLASLAAIATPAYAGEIVRSVFVRRQFGVPMSRTLPVLAVERGFDSLALATIGAATAGNTLVLALMLAATTGVLVVLTLAARFGRLAPITAPVIGRLTRRDVLVPAVLLSFAAWVPASWLISLAAASLGEHVALLQGMQIFSGSTLVGAISLLPAGVGTTGTAAILGLQDLGFDVPTSVSITTVFRLTTVGLTLAVGGICLAAELRSVTKKPAADSVEHFDEIADVYSSQLTPHIRDLLVTRKTDLIAGLLTEADAPVARGLDLGCGVGAHTIALAARGYRVIGVEPSVRSVVRARRAGATVTAGSGLALPFLDRTFDFVVVIGVLHHLPGDAARRQAFSEIHRVLRPGGTLLIHETNPRNPMFRFYMGYVFPIIRRIDEGTEQWLDPLQEVEGMTRETTRYATFLPDFVPRALLPLFLKIERRLEASRLRQYSVHYLAVFRRP